MEVNKKKQRMEKLAKIYFSNLYFFLFISCGNVFIQLNIR